MSGDVYEWRHGVDFAEVAEALGVKTTSVMAAMNPKADKVLVLYSEDKDVESVHDPLTDEVTIKRIWLKRDADGVLHQDSLPLELRGFWSEIMERVGRELEP